MSKAPESETYPLSFAQQRLWLLNEIESQSSQYNMPMAMQLDGILDVEGMVKALNTIVQRHQVLRTHYKTTENGDAIQVIDKSASLSAEVLDLTSIDEKAQRLEVRRLAEKESETPFDLSTDLMMRASLLQLSDCAHVLLLTLHHIASDGWSMGILADELSQLYRAYAADEENPLVPLPLQYADYAHWQQQWSKGTELDKQLGYWKAQLQGVPAIHSLALDRTRPVVLSYQGEVFNQTLSRDLQRQLNQLTNAKGVTLFMLFNAAFVVLLSRHSGETDIVIGSPIANREQDELAPLVGFFVNTLVLRSKLSDDLTFSQLLQQSKSTLLSAYDNQQVPFEKLVEVLQPQRSMEHSPLFQVMLSLNNNQKNIFELPELIIKPLEEGQVLAKFDLSLAISEGENGLSLNWEYMTSLFDRATIERMAAQFAVMLTALAVTPDSKVSELPLITSQERDLMLAQYQQTSLKFDDSICVHQLFEAQVESTPDAVAVAFEGQALNYRKLNDKANQLAHYLCEQGVKPDTLVGLCLNRSLEMVIGVLAILKAGGAYVPLNPEYPQGYLDYIIEDADVELVLSVQAMRASLRFDQCQTVYLDLSELFGHFPTENLASDALGLTTQNLIYAIYTSGSTGKPKGVMLHHSGVVNYLEGVMQDYGITHTQGGIVSSPLSFDATVTSLYAPLLMGKGIRLLSTDKNELQQLADVLSQADNPLLFKMTPAHLEGLKIIANQREMSNLPHVIVVGGEQLNSALMLTYKQTLLPQSVFINEYGPTETVVGCCTYQVKNLEQSWAKKVVVPIGRAIRNTGLYVVSRDGRQLVAPGSQGELYISGAGLARGYIKRAQLTKACFVTTAFDRQLWYKTGDLVRLGSDGEMIFIGRIDEQVKVNGFRIELGEIENRLQQDASVLAAVATIFKSNNLTSIVAYVVPSDHTRFDEQALRDHLAQVLPTHMVPHRFMLINELPMTGNGKVDRKSLPEPDFSKQVTAEYVAPDSKIEQQFCQHWQELLQVKRVGVADNFFSLGGHSLLATRLVAWVRQQWQVDISVKSIFEYQTIRALTPVVEQGKPTQQISIKASTKSASYALSFAQQRLWLLNQMEPDSSQYNIPMALRLEGVLDIAAIHRALETIIERHQILRTVYCMNEDKAGIQVVNDPLELLLSTIDLQHLDEQAQTRQVTQLSAEEAATPFRLSSDLMLRASLLKLSAQSHVLLITLHHIASDGWSMGVLADELNQLYIAYVTGQDNPLPPLALQYVDYAQWQRNWLQGDELTRQLDYWKMQLQGLPTVHSLPLDRSRPSVPDYHGGCVSQSLSPQLLQQLNILAQANGATLFMLLNAAFSCLLGRHSGEQDIVIGSPIANREKAELAPLVGFFVNTLVLRIDLADDPSFIDVLAQSKTNLLAAYEHQQVSFEKLVDELQPQRRLSHSPLFQVMLTLDNNVEKAIYLQGLTAHKLDNSATHTKYELTLGVSENDTGLHVNWEYMTALFDKATIERLVGHFAVMLQGLVTNSQRKVSELPLTTTAEQEMMLAQYQNSGVEYDREICLHQMFEACVADTPDAVAAVFGEQQLTYRQLNSKANQLAHYLRSQGVAPDSLVGLCVNRSLNMILGLLAILKAGGAYVPLDPSYPKARLNYIIEDAGVELVLTERALAQELVLNNQETVYLEELSGLLPSQTDNLDCESLGLSAQNLAYVIYTSGSTGKPKGVMLEHGGVTNYLNAVIQDYGIDHTRGGIVSSPLSFDATVTSLYTPLLTGKGIRLLSNGDELQQLVQLLTNSQQPLLFKMTPAHLEGVKIIANEACLSRLKHVIVVGGEQLNTSLMQDFKQVLLPNSVFINEYGPTEAAVGCCIYRVENLVQGWTDNTAVPIGKAIRNTGLYVVDANGGLAAPGTRGELYISGGGVARGYINRSELTRQCFGENHFGEGRWYKTGDLVRLGSDGEQIFIGRIDEQIKVNGFRIELGEIESQLQQHKSIAASAAVIRKTGDVVNIIAYVVSNEHGVFDEQVLHDHLQQTLPVFMVPHRIVELDNIPVTSNGKVDRKSLPEISGESLLQGYIAPTTELEHTICKVWQQLLSVDKVSVNDNFFRLGGDSLALLRCQSLLSDLGIKVHNQGFYQYQTVATLVAHIDNSVADEEQSLVLMNKSSQTLKIFCVHPGSGIVGSYRCMAEALSDMAQFYAIQAPDIVSNHNTNSLSALADYYVELIQHIQDKGPYVLMGWSLGGELAYEMSCRLKAKGEQTPLLLLFDSVPMTHQPRDKNGPFIDAIRYFHGDAVDIDWQQQQALPLAESLPVIISAFNAQKVIPQGVSILTLKKYLTFLCNVEAARHHYQPKPSNQSITLFRVTDNEGRAVLPECYGWSQLNGGDVTIEIVEGEHLTMFESQYGATLAAKVREHIQLYQITVGELILGR